MTLGSTCIEFVVHDQPAVTVDKQIKRSSFTLHGLSNDRAHNCKRSPLGMVKARDGDASMEKPTSRGGRWLGLKLELATRN